MAEAVTLELPEDVVGHAREVARRTGRKMADVLTDWLKSGAASEGMMLVLPDADYHIYTPYGNESVAQGLLDVLYGGETPERADETHP